MAKVTVHVSGRLTMSKELSCDQGYSWGENSSILSARTKGA